MKALATILDYSQPLALLDLRDFFGSMETFSLQTHAFLDEVTDVAYTVLQAEQDKTWSQIDQRKASFTKFLIPTIQSVKMMKIL